MYLNWQSYPENFPEPYETYLITYINGEGKPAVSVGIYEDSHALWYIPELTESVRDARCEDNEIDRIIAFAELPEPADLPWNYEEDLKAGKTLPPL